MRGGPGLGGVLRGDGGGLGVRKRGRDFFGRVRGARTQAHETARVALGRAELRALALRRRVRVRVRVLVLVRGREVEGARREAIAPGASARGGRVLARVGRVLVGGEVRVLLLRGDVVGVQGMVRGVRGMLVQARGLG